MRLAHASTYLMNAIFVLMTTNYTINPEFYFLGGGGSSSNGGVSSLLIYFPVLKIVLGIVYSVLKVWASD